MLKLSQAGTAYQLSGDKAAPTIVLIHGLGLHHEIWNAYLPALEQHYQVLNYDLLGHGQSAKPPKQLNLSVFAEQLRMLLDELEIKQCAIIGFSLGGMINRRFAMDNPGRSWALAILNSPHERGEVAQKLVEKRASDTAQGGPEANLDATIARWFTPRFREQHPDYIEQVRKWVVANDPVSYAQCRQVLATGVIELIRPSVALTQPTLVVTCENDSGSTPAMSQEIAREINGAQILIIPELQHMGLTEQPQLFLPPLLDFLATAAMQTN